MEQKPFLVCLIKVVNFLVERIICIFDLIFIPDEKGGSWSACVVEPCVQIVRTFLLGEDSLTSNEATNDILRQRQVSRELCTQYVCEVGRNDTS